jgi:hypothetical protein
MRKCGCGKRLGGTERIKAYNRSRGTILSTCRDKKGDYVKIGNDYFVEQKKGNSSPKRDYFARKTAEEIYRWNCMGRELK